MLTSNTLAEPITAALYVRLSAADQAAVAAARAQESPAAAEAVLQQKAAEHRADGLDYAGEHGLHIPADLQFIEANMTASIRGTKALPERDRLMAWLRTCTGPAYILVNEASRLFRDVKKSAALQDEAKRLLRDNPNAALHVLTVVGKDYDLSTASGLGSFLADMAASQTEADLASERRRRKAKRRARAGYYSGWRPFGYDKVPDRDAPPGAPVRRVDLVVNGREAAAIRDAGARVIAAAAAGTYALGKIAAEWNAAGLTTARGNRWTGHKAGEMLRNPLYAEHPAAPGRGTRTARPGSLYGRPGRDVPPAVWPGRHEALFDVATAAALLAALNREGRPGGDGEHLLKYPLSGLAVCGAVKDDGTECGARLRAAPAYGGRRQLVCPGPPKGCGGVGRIMGPVEDWVREVVFWWLRPGGDYDTATQRAETVRGAGDHTARLAAIDAAERVHLAGLAGFEDQLFTGDFGPGVTREMAGRTAERHRRAADALATERDALIRRATAAARPVPAREIDWPAMTAEAKRDWLGDLVDAVKIHPARKGMAAFDLAKIEIVPGGWADGHRVTWPAVPMLVPRAIAAAPRTCDLPGCGRPHRHGPPGAGLCGMHRIRQLAAERAGHPEEWDRSPAERRGYSGGLGKKRGPAKVFDSTCVLPGCDRNQFSGELCNMHRQRKARAAKAGHPEEWDRTPRPPGSAAPPALAGLAWRQNP